MLAIIIENIEKEGTIKDTIDIDKKSIFYNDATQLINEKRVDQETFEQAVSKYGEQGVTELTATIGYYGMLACALNVFEVIPESGKPTLI